MMAKKLYCEQKYKCMSSYVFFFVNNFYDDIFFVVIWLPGVFLNLNRLIHFYDNFQSYFVFYFKQMIKCAMETFSKVCVVIHYLAPTRKLLDKIIRLNWIGTDIIY